MAGVRGWGWGGGEREFPILWHRPTQLGRSVVSNPSSAEKKEDGRLVLLAFVALISRE